jgi:hypothetical protein
MHINVLKRICSFITNGISEWPLKRAIISWAAQLCRCNKLPRSTYNAILRTSGDYCWSHAHLHVLNAPIDIPTTCKWDRPRKPGQMRPSWEDFISWKGFMMANPANRPEPVRLSILSHSIWYPNLKPNPLGKHDG